MKEFVIICDVTCDLNEELRKRFNIEYVKGHMTTPEGKEIETDWERDLTSSTTLTKLSLLRPHSLPKFTIALLAPKFPVALLAPHVS